LQQRCSASCANARCARQLVGGITAQGDKIRNLPGIDAISRANFGWIDTRHLASADGIEDGGTIRGKLERVAVATRYKDAATTPFFRRCSGSEKIIRLVTRRFRIPKAAGGNKFRQHLKLLEQGVVEFASALISRKLLMPVATS